MKKSIISFAVLLATAPIGFSLGGREDVPGKAGFPQKTLWVANGLDDTLSIIDLENLTTSKTLPSGTNPHILSASPGGKYVYVINAGRHDREPVASGDDENSSGKSGGKNSAMAGEHGRLAGDSLWVYNGATGDVTAKIRVGKGPTHPIPSLDGKFVYVTNTDEQSVSVIETATWTVTGVIADVPEPHDGALSADDRLLFLSTSGNGALSVVDTSTLKIVRTFKVGNKPRGLVAGGPDGKTVFLTNKGDGTLSIIDIANAKQKTVSVGKGPHALRLSPGGDRVYIALSKEDAVAVVDVQSGGLIRKIPVGKLPEQIDLSADGFRLFAGNNGEGTITVIDTRTYSALKTVKVGKGAYGLQAFPGIPEIHSTFSNQGAIVRISAGELKQSMENKNFTLVDVHIPLEKEIPGTDLRIPYNEIEKNTQKLPGKNEPIVLYCRSGSMSTAAYKKLIALGYNSVTELEGGFNAWERAGYELKLP